MGRKGTVFAAALAIVFGTVGITSTAAADQDGSYYGYGLPYSVYSLESIPYFALHPPVYYSHPVARPYGYSPYAVPPGVRPAEFDHPEPEMVINPYVPRDEIQPTKAKPTPRVAVKRIPNPFFVTSAK